MAENSPALGEPQQEKVLQNLTQQIYASMVRAPVEELEELRQTAQLYPAAFDAAIKQLHTGYGLRSRVEAVDVVPRVQLSGWKAPDKCRATETEVLILSLLLVANNSNSQLAVVDWAREVLASQDRAEQEVGDHWRPPPDDPAWNSSGALLSTLRNALVDSSCPVVSKVVANWPAQEGGTDGAISLTSLRSWMSSCKRGGLRGVARGKTSGSPRHVSAVVRVARLLKQSGLALASEYEAAARTMDDKKTGTKEELNEKILEMERAHEVEIVNLNHTIEELYVVAADAEARASKQAKLRGQAVKRGKDVRKESRAFFKEKLKKMADGMRAAAVEDVEAAHGSAMMRLRELKAQANAAKRAAKKTAAGALELSGKRLARAEEAEELVKLLQQHIDELEHELHNGAADALEKLSQLRQVKTEGQASGRRGRWWPWWVRAMIMEQLVNGTTPTAIPGNIASDAAYLVPFLEVHVPTVEFCRRVRGELRILTETLAAYRIAKSGKWRQLFTDGTSRRQTALLTAIIGIDGPDGELLPIILRGAFVGSSETAEAQVDDILERAIKRGGNKLQRLRETFSELFPGVAHDIPDASEMDIVKLAGGAVTSDNCATAMKVKRLLVEKVQEAVQSTYNAEEWAAFTEEERAQKQQVYEVDCWNHLRNVWLGAVSNELTNQLRETLKEELDAIDFRLRVGTGMEGLLRAVDKEFSLCANYPKGHGDLFREWAYHTHPRTLLFHVEHTAGSRQDLAFEGAGAVYMNRVIWTEFLDERLRMPRTENILQECLYILLTSVEMVASMRIHSIIHLAIVIPLRWLAGKTHTLAQHDWSERSMGQAVDLLEKAMLVAKDDGSRMLDKSFMLGIFQPLIDALPPLKEYLKHMYDEKQMALVGSSITERQYCKLRDELFDPVDEDNQESSELATALGAAAALTIVMEVRDPKKATSRHLSSADGVFSWGNTTAADHEATKRRMAVNDPAESSFGGLTRELSVFGRIGFGNASGVSMARRNRDFQRGAVAVEKRKERKEITPMDSRAALADAQTGLFHSCSVQMREALITMAARTLKMETEIDRADLAAQRSERKRKEELAAAQGREKASEEYIDALYYYEMWTGPVCWKTVAAAELEFAKLKSKSAKLEALKEQIRIRVLGLGWKDLATAWSSEGKPFTPAQLMEHLKKIIGEQSTRVIPDKPPVPGLARKPLPMLGKRTAFVAKLDAREAASSWAVEAAARATKANREAKGIGDSYQQRQPSRPELNESMIGKRIEVVFHYALPDGVFGDALMWCSGEILDLDPQPYTTFPKGKSATVRWDANDRVEPAEPMSISGVKLLPTRWNKDGYLAWRFDLDPL